MFYSSSINVEVIENPINVNVSIGAPDNIIINKLGIQGPIGPSGQTIITSGVLTGEYYPLTGNPAGYITSGDLPSTSGINIEDVVFTTGNQTINGDKTFINNLIIDGGAGERVYFSQKPNGEFVWGLNVNALNGDAMDVPFDSAFKFGMMTTDLNGGSDGYNGLHLQAQPIGIGSWANAPTVWSVDVLGNMNANGNVIGANFQTSSFVYTPQIIYNDSTSINLVGNNISDHNGIFSLDWSNRELFVTDGSISINWEQRLLLDSQGSSALDWGGRILKDAYQNYSILFDTRVMRNSAQVNVLDWQNTLLVDGNGIESIDWTNRWLVDTNDLASIYWNDRVLSGIWDVRGGLTISGVPVSTGFNTSHYLTTGNILSITTTLNSGVNFQQVLYNNILSGNPSSVNCTMQNNSDNYVYSFVISSVSNSGFFVSFSDYLSNTGYILNSVVIV